MRTDGSDAISCRSQRPSPSPASPFYISQAHNSAPTEQSGDARLHEHLPVSAHLQITPTFRHSRANRPPTDPVPQGPKIPPSLPRHAAAQCVSRLEDLQPFPKLPKSLVSLALVCTTDSPDPNLTSQAPLFPAACPLYLVPRQIFLPISLRPKILGFTIKVSTVTALTPPITLCYGILNRSPPPAPSGETSGHPLLPATPQKYDLSHSTTYSSALPRSRSLLQLPPG